MEKKRDYRATNLILKESDYTAIKVIQASIGTSRNSVAIRYAIRNTAKRLNAEGQGGDSHGKQQ